MADETILNEVEPADAQPQDEIGDAPQDTELGEAAGAETGDAETGESKIASEQQSRKYAGIFDSEEQLEKGYKNAAGELTNQFQENARLRAEIEALRLQRQAPLTEESEKPDELTEMAKEYSDPLVPKLVETVNDLQAQQAERRRRDEAIIAQNEQAAAGLFFAELNNLVDKSGHRGDPKKLAEIENSINAVIPGNLTLAGIAQQVQATGRINPGIVKNLSSIFDMALKANSAPAANSAAKRRKKADLEVAARAGTLGAGTASGTGSKPEKPKTWKDALAAAKGKPR